MSGRFLFLKNTVGTPGAIAAPPNGHEIAVLEQPAFTPDALETVCGLLLGQHLDEYHLGTLRPGLDAFLARGGAVATMGPIAVPYMSILRPHRPEGSGRRDDWILEIAGDHPIVDGVSAGDITFRKGVVGFWARGSIAPPDDARIVTRFAATGAPADWVWHGPQGAKLFVHPGNDVWGYAQEPNSSARIFAQLLDWMAA
ncbi:hypothetical protein [Rhodophyticola porphyridii]|uniref:hypothetical protein n=1 Tax=Rhodophyticola porphyridii TaxID=1852017 RepID=UPI0035CF9559